MGKMVDVSIPNGFQDNPGPLIKAFKNIPGVTQVRRRRKRGHQSNLRLRVCCTEEQTQSQVENEVSLVAEEYGSEIM